MSTSFVRPPTFARKGWYPADGAQLQAELEQYLAEAGPAAVPEPVRAIISPHAGYRYCGHVAGATYGRARVPGAAIVIGVDHWHGGAPHAIQCAGAWELPTGRLEIHEQLATRLQQALGFLEEDPRALELEHSLEMQCPFLWKRNPAVRIVPIQLGYLREEEALRAGEALGRAVQEHEADAGEQVLLVASTDLHHQEQPFHARDDRLTREKDERAIERILAGDAAGLLRRVRDEDIGVCGVVPVALVLVAARLLGAGKPALVRHATSAEIPPHNYSYVVGYGGFLLR